MIALWMAVFFTVAALGAWLVMFPAARDGVWADADRLRARMRAVVVRWQSRAGARAADGSCALGAVTARVGRSLRRHRWLLAGIVPVLIVPPLLILQARQQVVLDGFDDHAVVAADDHVIALLRGERLAPPPDLPPAVFVAAEAEWRRTTAAISTVVAPAAIASADRRWERIDPDFRQRVLAIFRVMREQHGYEMVLVEGYRSPGRQAALARQGGSVTRAGAGQSCHQYGVAVDAALYRDGRLHWDMGDAWTRRGYALYGELAVQAGLEWGGSWRSLKDYVHLEMKARCRQARRAAGH
jgi:peptidoglycan L-alanyl-D-glutamate endopeptidase CwlK